MPGEGGPSVHPDHGNSAKYGAKPMTNAMHTQGPWVPTARTGEGLTPATYVIEDADRLPVVMAWRAADARLIAAAPDMLAALSDIILSSDANCGDSLANAIEAARVAIAKAKGA